jgi:hypothetical protein
MSTSCGDSFSQILNRGKDQGVHSSREFKSQTMDDFWRRQELHFIFALLEWLLCEWLHILLPERSKVQE